MWPNPSPTGPNELHIVMVGRKADRVSTPSPGEVSALEIKELDRFNATEFVFKQFLDD
jgi:hypothetical protein